jgi:hypothetical protein
MARMTYFREIIKRDLFKRITFLRTFLSDKDVLASVAAEEHDRPLHRLSFAGTMQRFHAAAPYLRLFSGTPKGRRLYQLLLSWIACDILLCRPNRVEPRAVKRRPKEYPLLNRPRNEMRKALPGA